MPNTSAPMNMGMPIQGVHPVWVNGLGFCFPVCFPMAQSAPMAGFQMLKENAYDEQAYHWNSMPKQMVPKNNTKKLRRGEQNKNNSFSPKPQTSDSTTASSTSQSFEGASEDGNVSPEVRAQRQETATNLE